MSTRHGGRVVHPAATPQAPTRLYGRRIMLRPLTESDFDAYGEVRRRNGDWLTSWEPSRPAGTSEAMRLSALLGKLGTHDTAKITRNGKQVRGWRVKPKA